MSTKRIKQYLLLVTAVGVVAVAASGAGTFATFNAEVSNNGNTFTAGTLFLHDTSGSNTCTSEQGTSNANNGSDFTDTTNGCSVLFDVNLGKATLSTTLAANASGTAVSSISVAGLNAAVSPGDVLTLNNGTNTENVIVKTAVAATNTNPTSIPIYTEDLAHSYTTGNTVTAVDTTHYATLALNDAGSLAASDVKFYLPGCTPGHPTSESIGSFTAAGVYSSPSTTFTLSSASTYTVPAGQNMKIGSHLYPLVTGLTAGTSTSVVVTGDASAETAPGTISWVPTFTTQDFCTSGEVTIAETDPSFDLTSAKNPVCVFGATSGDVFGCQFDSAHALQGGGSSPASTAAGASALPLVSGSSAGDVGNGNSGTGLDAGGTRYFLIGVKLPASSNNDYQNQSATFGLSWHIDAA